MEPIKPIEGQEVLFPNFLNSIFAIREGDEEYLASQGDMAEVHKVFNSYYNIVDDHVLDSKNSFLNFINRAQENR